MDEKKNNRDMPLLGAYLGAGACLNPIRMRNKRTKPTIKNGGVPVAEEKQFEWVNIPCGWCAKCRQKRKREWIIRLTEELKNNKEKPHFITLTFSEEALKKIMGETSTDGNEVAVYAMKKWREKINKRRHKAIKRFTITEKGTQGTQRIHIHGIIWTKDRKEAEEVVRLWEYGRTDIGNRCDEGTAKYITKYLLKEDNNEFESIIMCSPGIGKGYLTKTNKEKHKFRGKDTNTGYIMSNGQICGLPKYFKDHIYNIEQKRELWKIGLEEPTTIIEGIKFLKTETEEIEKFRAEIRKKDRTKQKPKERTNEARIKAKEILEKEIQRTYEEDIRKKTKEMIIMIKTIEKAERDYERIKERREESKKDIDINGVLITKQPAIATGKKFKETDKYEKETKAIKKKEKEIEELIKKKDNRLTIEIYAGIKNIPKFKH